ncbi:MAG: hypothetical protein A2622_04065 [Bdellovibrionales bacterium RIFCSPHIGHO2_01_FULL_40_29]|nr:MAG: hypothetical protein A2622_04065 [Bdellovibrionales bacterium RIFCSPHIGHO2_01_FULL_40_29]OFZ34886.1 MAG: hypothetical protein A3D17_11310 [Bdellovibrionales bacterium RIFCSPHIGHO2_02_FULL_40_15]
MATTTLGQPMRSKSTIWWAIAIVAAILIAIALMVRAPRNTGISLTTPATTERAPTETGTGTETAPATTPGTPIDVVPGQ